MNKWLEVSVSFLHLNLIEIWLWRMYQVLGYSLFKENCEDIFRTLVSHDFNPEGYFF